MKTPGGWVSALVPQAWNSEMTMRTIVPGRQLRANTSELTAVEQGEGEVNEEFGREGFPAVVFGVDDVVDLADGSGDEQAHEERADEVAVGPEPDVDGVKDAEERETVRDAVNNEPGVSSHCQGASSLLAVVRELVQDHPEEEEVDQRPDPDRVRRGRHVGFLVVSTSMHVAADARGSGSGRLSGDRHSHELRRLWGMSAPLRHSHSHHGVTLHPNSVGIHGGGITHVRLVVSIVGSGDAVDLRSEGDSVDNDVEELHTTSA